MNSATVRWLTGQPPKLPRENNLPYPPSVRHEILKFDIQQLNHCVTDVSRRIPIAFGTDYETIDIIPAGTPEMRRSEREKDIGLLPRSAHESTKLEKEPEEVTPLDVTPIAKYRKLPQEVTDFLEEKSPPSVLQKKEYVEVVKKSIENDITIPRSKPIKIDLTKRR